MRLTGATRIAPNEATPTESIIFNTSYPIKPKKSHNIHFHTMDLSHANVTAISWLESYNEYLYDFIRTEHLEEEMKVRFAGDNAERVLLGAVEPQSA